jgi:Flp pilus assembly pilin Flp
MHRAITALWRDEAGSRAVDGAMTAAMAAAAVIAVMTAMGGSVEGLLQGIADIARGALSLIGG